MKIEWRAGQQAIPHRRGREGQINPICRRVRSGTRFTLDNAIPTGHQSVLADLIPFGSTISAERYFIERRFFSSLFVSIFSSRCVCVWRFTLRLGIKNIEVRKEDVTYLRWRLRRGFLVDFAKEIAY